jgi:hypothetical protein
MATTTPNFGWTVPTSSDLVKNGAVAIETLGDSIDASLVDLKGGTTDQVLAKNSNTDMDFKWVSDATGMTNPMTTTGDVIYSSSGSTPARLGIGTAGQVLQVNSGATAPEWATAAGGGGGMTFISRTSFSNVASQSFNGSFTSSFETYFMVIEELWAGNANDETHLQFTYAGPTTQTATYYGGAASLPYNAASWTAYGTNNLAHLILSADNGLSNEPFTGQYYFYRVGNSSERAYINGQSFSAVGSALEVFAGQQFTARTYTGFLLKSSSSNITGTVTLFGVNKA